MSSLFEIMFLPGGLQFPDLKKAGWFRDDRASSNPAGAAPCKLCPSFF